MSNRLTLDVDGVAEIGLLFLDGDSLEAVQLDPFGRHVDYDFDRFNICKTAVMKIERINPTLGLTAILWQWRPDNPDMALPSVAGRALPVTGYQAIRVTPALRGAFGGAFGCVTEHAVGGVSHYYPVKNSDGEVVGALELMDGRRPHVDI